MTQKESGQKRSLAEYDGEDRVITSRELWAVLSAEKEAVYVNAMSGIPGVDRACEGFQDGELIVISGPTKNGKCMKKGTKLLMHDGSIKAIEDVVVGDRLMGDDSSPRTVQSVCSGVDELFKIIPWQGNPYSVNKEHVLCLERCRSTNSKTDSLANTITEVSVMDYMAWSRTRKHIHKTYRVPVSFLERELPCDPYILGAWLGDGHSGGPEFTTADPEIAAAIRKYASTGGFQVTTKTQGGNKSIVYRLCDESGRHGKTGGVAKNRFKEFLKEYNLINNKHIPHIYKCNSKENRLKLLAGLIDTDGNHIKSTRGGAVEFVSKSVTLANDVAYLCRSLGFSCTPHKTIKKIKSRGFEGEYWVMRIGGDVSKIPCRIERKTRNGMKPFKHVLRSSFRVEPDGVGEYYGFTLDGNGRYLLEDFQVTHNTLLAQTITRNMAKSATFPLWFTFEVPARQFLSQFSPQLPLIYMPAKLKPRAMDWFEDRVMESLEKFGTRVVFVDHLHYLVDLARAKKFDVEIGAIIRRLKTLAVNNNLVIFLLCHTTKGRHNEDLSYESIRDSSFISQESDCCIMVKRTPEVLENRARARIEFHRRTGVMERVVELQKIDGRLVEVAK